ncbi:unnamed protein product (mitochondrion) [Plasmodiophora brassicae]|uniref:Phosphatidylinositol-glycan biosynthesis class X protein n=1 Tax=Plasmodiophora brassicae TaxID=37360 RepID=A0A0G4J792_PLABS|nr:hypothetical protein PBRA_002984 [Plasmodiophora brassicae]SPQ95464.1 unnamed protein product [Plasmodiophora brassicae]
MAAGHIVVVIVTCLIAAHAYEQVEGADESVWYQVAFWPSDLRDTEPVFEVHWPDAGSQEYRAEHVVVPPRDHGWGAQFTIAETISNRPELTAPPDVLSLEIRQTQSSTDYIIVLELEDDENVTSAVHYIDELLHAEGEITAALLQSPSQDKFARIPLDMIDFWRFDLRLPTSAIDPNAPSAFVARISDLDALPFSFFNETYDERVSPLCSWLLTRRSIWSRFGNFTTVGVTKYLRIVGQYALFAEAVRNEHRGSSDDVDGPELQIRFNANVMNAEIEVILAHWSAESYLTGRVLHVGGDERRTLNLSSPVWWNAGLDAVCERHVAGRGFHRQLDTRILIPEGIRGAPFSVLIIEVLPEGVFIDPDELQRLNGMKHIDAFVIGDPINFEAPAFLSKQVVVLFQLNVTSSENRWVNVSIPIHLRYQLSSDTSDPARIHLSAPYIFVKTEDPDQSGVCARTGMIWPQPFMVEAHLSQCPGWRTLDLHFDNDVRQTNPEYTVQLPDGGAVVFIPVGELSRRQLVTIVTFSCTSFAALLIIVVLCASVRSQGDKNVDSTKKEQ